MKNRFMKVDLTDLKPIWIFLISLGMSKWERLRPKIPQQNLQINTLHPLKNLHILMMYKLRHSTFLEELEVLLNMKAFKIWSVWQRTMKTFRNKLRLQFPKRDSTELLQDWTTQFIVEVLWKQMYMILTFSQVPQKMLL